MEISLRNATIWLLHKGDVQSITWHRFQPISSKYPVSQYQVISFSRAVEEEMENLGLTMSLSKIIYCKTGTITGFIAFFVPKGWGPAEDGVQLNLTWFFSLYVYVIEYFKWAFMWPLFVGEKKKQLLKESTRNIIFRLCLMVRRTRLSFNLHLKIIL